MKRRVFSATAWDLTETFFEAMREYRQIYILYETQVLAHAEEQAVDRYQLRLDATEVSKLLDFSRLMHLRNGALFRAKDISHRLFRSEGRTTKFDRFISEIFHELSILREEQYKVSTFAEEYRRENALAEYESLLDEVHEDFPRRVNSIHELFKKAQRALEIVLRARRQDPIYLRSLVLFGDATVRDAYPDGVAGHAWAVFDRGPGEAFYWAARSFACRGFKKEALGAIERALEFCATTASFRQVDLSDIVRDLEEFRTIVSERSPVELVQTLGDEATEPLYASDAVTVEPDETETVHQG
ncbi:MAG: hypothetical protein KDD82_02495 [Planctomycetes bacterium]|nr:hypothetical protein [Planctomycetota bacterium]